MVVHTVPRQNLTAEDKPVVLEPIPQEGSRFCLSATLSSVRAPPTLVSGVRCTGTCQTTKSSMASWGTFGALQLSPPSWQCTWFDFSGAVKSLTTAQEHWPSTLRAPKPTRT